LLATDNNRMNKYLYFTGIGNDIDYFGGAIIEKKTAFYIHVLIGYHKARNETTRYQACENSYRPRMLSRPYTASGIDMGRHPGPSTLFLQSGQRLLLCVKEVSMHSG
jgi:hypothetical protein